MQNDNDNILIPYEQEPDEQIGTRFVEWKWEEVNENQINLEEFPFSDLEGLKIRMKNDLSPLDFFKLYLNNEIIELLVREINWYANQFLEDKPVTNTYLRKWTGVIVDDMNQSIGVLLLMGIVYKPTHVNKLLLTMIFREITNRFYIYFFHFNDNRDPEYDQNDENCNQLHKIHPFLDLIQNNCKLVYSPGKNLSVDESLVLFKGRLKFKQYIKTKRKVRFGIKLYEPTT